MTGLNPALLLLADGRFPAGGHAHSSGTKAAVKAGDVTDIATLRLFVEGRLATSGLVDAAFAAATCWRSARPGDADWRELDAEYLARTGPPRLRLAARTLGRQLLRSGERAWPSSRYGEARAALPDGVVQPIAMGVVANAAGCSPAEAALCELHHLVGTLTTGAVRLLGLDPFIVAALGASTAPELTRLAALAASTCEHPAANLPADLGLLNDVFAEHHGTWEVRLFAS